MARATSRLIRLRQSDAPETPIEELLTQVREHLFLPDPSAFYAVMGTMAANLIQGVPVWLMLVGPPGAGGTELLNMLDDIPGVYEAGGIESNAAFLSGTAAKDKSAHATGGLLVQVGSHGCITLKDYTEILNQPEDSRKKIVATLRRVYDGEWTRPLGTDGGKVLRWPVGGGRGKAALLGKCTSVIDMHLTEFIALGERWIYYRYPRVMSGFEKSRRAGKNANVKEWKQTLAALVRNFFLLKLELEFGRNDTRRDLTDAETHRLNNMAELAARARSGVKRDRRTYELLGCDDTEDSTRLNLALGQLLLGLEVIGVREEMRWELLGKIALDSMAAVRQVVFMGAVRADKEFGRRWNNGRALESDRDGRVGVSELVIESKAARGVVERAVEELEVHGVVHSGREDKDLRVGLTEEAKGLYRKGWVR